MIGAKRMTEIARSTTEKIVDLIDACKNISVTNVHVTVVSVD